MSAAPSADQASHSNISTGPDGDGRALPPPVPFDPSTWKNFYYACMVATILVGLGTLLNGGVWTDAILRMFVTLLGGSVLTIAFLTFVIVPLHVRRYEHLVAAQKAEREAARAKAATAKEESEAEAETTARRRVGDREPAISFSREENTAEILTDRVQHDDQAASLRRMAIDSR